MPLELTLEVDTTLVVNLASHFLVALLGAEPKILTTRRYLAASMATHTTAVVSFVS